MTYLASVVTIPVGIISAINTRANLLDATRMRNQAAIDLIHLLEKHGANKEPMTYMMAIRQKRREMNSTSF